MIKCQACGTENLDSSQFCDECGSALDSSSSESEQAAEAPLVAGAGATNANTPISMPAILRLWSRKAKSR